MTLAVLPDEDDIQYLRQTNYNAQVVDRNDVNDELTILRVRPDHGVTSFEPGQYSVMGLGAWEPRVPGCQEEHPERMHVGLPAPRSPLDRELAGPREE